MARARITIALDRLERENLSIIKTVGEGVHELRVSFGPGYRVYFGWDGREIVILLGGGTKKQQQSDIREAKRLWQEYKERKRERT
jgi:putative addiction module killer protein